MVCGVLIGRDGWQAGAAGKPGRGERVEWLDVSELSLRSGGCKFGYVTVYATFTAWDEVRGRGGVASWIGRGFCCVVSVFVRQRGRQTL